ncbi:histamine H3 receptor-like [Diadema setosum]|uniref:histamine H3 receptor-like n=1 Tax=Diadema setosum TaxID=31175 RepID=UPI003B3A373E
MSLESTTDGFNSTELHYDSNVSTHSKAWLATVPLVLSVIMFVTMVGNSFVVWAFIRDVKVRTNVANVFIVNLAVVDFLTASVILPFNTDWLVKEVWLYGEVFCKIWCALDNALLNMAVITILLISWDRLCLLTMGMKYRSFQTKRRVGMILFACWTVTLAVYIFLAFAWSSITGEYNIDFDTDCEMEYSANLTATVIINTINFVIPFFFLVALNSAIFVNIRKRSKGSVGPSPQVNVYDKSLVRHKDNTAPPLSRGSQKACRESGRCESDRVAIPDAPGRKETPEDVQNVNRTAGDTTTRERRFLARHQKAAFVLAVLVGCFLACWLPYQITSAMFAVCAYDCVSELAWEVTNTILWCNATINPFIYAATNVHFRRNFRHFLLLDRWTCDGCRLKHRSVNKDDSLRDTMNETAY